jgi:hypothetical protein
LPVVFVVFGTLPLNQKTEHDVRVFQMSGFIIYTVKMCHEDAQTKEDEMCGARSMPGRKEKCIQNSNWRT